MWSKNWKIKDLCAKRESDSILLVKKPNYTDIYIPGKHDSSFEEISQKMPGTRENFTLENPTEKQKSFNAFIIK